MQIVITHVTPLGPECTSVGAYDSVAAIPDREWTIKRMSRKIDWARQFIIRR